MECLNVTTSGGTGFFAPLLTSTLSALTAASCLLVDPAQWPPDRSDMFLNSEPMEYDFIVVGAGSSGSVVANRLTEEAGWKVLLVEAGGDPPIESQIPSLYMTNLGTEVDWQYETEENPNCCQAMQNKKCHLPRGKVLGGSGAINDPLYLRGNRKDYDDWEALGNTGWGYDQILEYFKKSENQQDKRIKKMPNYLLFHGNTGNVHVAKINNSFYLGKRIIRAYEELRHVVLKDVNGEAQLGISSASGNIRNGVRNTGAHAFLTTAKDRTNLDVVKHARVTKILIDNATKKVEGIKMLMKNGEEVSVKATKEVVLTAGAINNVQILMLSGIGPSNILQENAIEIVSNVRVGENFQDHIKVPVFYALPTNYTFLNDMSTSLTQYLTNNYDKGMMESVNSETIGFINTKNDNSPAPDIQHQYVIFTANSSLLEVTVEKMGYDEEYVRLYKAMNKGQHIIQVNVILLSPKSRGSVKITSNSPLDKPMVTGNYLSDDSEIITLLHGINEVMKLEKTNAFMAEKAKLTRMDYQACVGHPFRSEAYWRCMIKYTSSSLSHPVGTVSMGPASDPGAVVCPQLRVRGVEGLRVADESVMPTIIRGNLNAVSTMIGEKAADFIKKDWQMKKIHMEL